MNEELFESVSRLRAWVRDYGHEKNPVFVKDLETVLEFLTPTVSAVTISSDCDMSKIATIADHDSQEPGVLPWNTETGQNACSCHERDGSYVCDFCYSQGRRGHLQREAVS